MTQTSHSWATSFLKRYC